MVGETGEGTCQKEGHPQFLLRQQNVGIVSSKFLDPEVSVKFLGIINHTIFLKELFYSMPIYKRKG